MTVEITAKRDGFRRCGVEHSGTTQTYEDGYWTPAQLKELQGEPQLVVTVISADQQAAKVTPTKALIAAQEQVTNLTAQLEAKTQDVANLTAQLADSQRQLQQAQQQVTAITAERDALLAAQPPAEEPKK